MTAIVDADSQLREVRRVVDNDQSGDGDNSPRAQLIQVESLGKGAWALVASAIVASILAIIIAMDARGNARLSEARAWQAEREARIAQEKVDRLEVGLGKKGININTDGH